MIKNLFAILFTNLLIFHTLLAAPDCPELIAGLPEEGAAPCQHYDFSKEPKDTDGIPICPALQPTQTPWDYMMCAFKQATVFTPPTRAQTQLVDALVQDLHRENASGILQNADKLGAQVCRVQSADDPFLVMITKPGNNAYSGVFLLVRKPAHASPYILQNAHDQTCTPGRETKSLFTKTKAFMAMSNGYPRAIEPKMKTCWGESYRSDGSHNINNLWWHYHTAIAQEFADTAFFHFHGMSNKGMEITNSLAFDVGPNSLLHAFTTAVKTHIIDPNPDPSYYSHFIVGAPGTPLTHVPLQINATWVPGRQLVLAPNPACGNGHQNTNRFIGFEQGPELWLHEDKLVPVFQDLENGFFKGRVVKQ